MKIEKCFVNLNKDMLYLLDCNYNDNDNKLICTILDYNYLCPRKSETFLVSIEWNKKIKVRCNCRNKFFQFTCPHKKWFGLVYLNSYNPIFWSRDKLEKFKEININYQIKPGQNDECLICFEELQYNMENTLRCNKCNYSIHKKCWNEYVIRSKKAVNNCILCKSETMPNGFKLVQRYH